MSSYLRSKPFCFAANDQENVSVSPMPVDSGNNDLYAGATRTVQDSCDGISGATVRMAREATSYQRALAEAGIIEEEGE